MPGLRALLVVVLALVPACEDFRVAAGARDLLAHYQRCKLVDAESGVLARDAEGRIDALRPGRGTVRCRHGKELVTVRLEVVAPASLSIRGPRALAPGAVATYFLEAKDARGRALRVGRVGFEHGRELVAVSRCPRDLPACPDFLDSIELRLAEGASRARLRACVTRCAEAEIRRNLEGAAATR